MKHLHKRGQQVRLVGLKFPVSVSWYYLKRENGKLENDLFCLPNPSKQARLHGGKTEMADRGLV